MRFVVQASQTPTGEPTFIEGPEELYGNDFLAPYLAPSATTRRCPALVGRYHPTWHLLQVQSALLAALPGWRSTYDRAVVDVRDE